MPIYFAVTLFVSAALLFLVQPMVGRMILPLLGGTPTVWNTCMLFFQALLLGGYVYSHLLTTKLRPRSQVAVHLVVVFLPLIAFAVAVALAEKGMPIPVLDSLAPEGVKYPIPSVLLILGVAVGLPFFVVSTSAPLLQKWFAGTGHEAGRDPYYLYAASNLGSLLALLAYPLALEPSFTVGTQTWVFAGGYGLLALLIAGCGIAVRGAQRTAGPTVATVGATDSGQPDEPPPTWPRRLRWLALAFAPSSMMLGVTYYITTDIAALPLLWVIPLSLYLLSFIIAFSRLPSWVIPFVGLVTPVLLLLAVFLLTTNRNELPFSVTLGVHLLTFFAVAVTCHGLLAADRPPTKYLTGFYLWMSVGGLLGGVFNGLLAPMIFVTAREYILTVVVACFLIPRLSKKGFTRTEVANSFALAVLFFGAVTFLVMWRWELWDLVARVFDTQQTINFLTSVIVFGLPPLLCFLFVDRPVRFGLCVAGVVLGHAWAETSSDEDDGVLARVRSYFGSLKVEADYDTDQGTVIRRIELIHGTTLHGAQYYPQEAVQRSIATAAAPLSLSNPLLMPFMAEAYWQDWKAPGRYPITYYHANGSVGHIVRSVKSRFPYGELGVVGLGTGTMSAYVDPGQSITFYEIDPTVIELVEPPDYFTFIHNARQQLESEATPMENYEAVKFVLGDARLMLERSDKKFSLLAVDAFSSDAIPVHLLTREAVELYLNRVEPGGVVALHLSNRHLLLLPVVARIAEELGVEVRYRDDVPVDEIGLYGSTWAVVTRKPEDLGELADWPEPPIDPDVPAWTDDYSNLMSVLTLPGLQEARAFFGLREPVEE